MNEYRQKIVKLVSSIRLSILFIAISCALAKPITANKSIVNTRTQFTAPLSEQLLDITYSGDVSNLPQLLRQYDSSLALLPNLGKAQALNINLDLASVNLNDINEVVMNQTENRVSLVYDKAKDSLRMKFVAARDVGYDAVHESLKWQNGGAPKPILQADGVVRYPYGQYQPVVTCQPLNLCDIELQAGEEIQGIVIGDSIRWNEGDQSIPVVYSGSGKGLTPHLIVKPSSGGLETSLVVTTSLRTYMFKLKSSFSDYVARVGFYYPSEMVQKFESNKAKLRQGLSGNANALANLGVQMPLIDLSRVNYNYTIDGGDYPWTPTHVFDDGISVYIQMPMEVSSRSLPGLCVMLDGASGSDNRCEMVNFRYNEHFYIVDKLFEQARLINGYGDNIQTVTIKHKAKPGFWARFFGAT
ncbi:MAG: P-type conjugative transfer protein TrbG [Burkholderiales bacterium]|nr:P-type conjugative transfer protein TrbG [Burkholderiales bacterium]